MIAKLFENIKPGDMINLPMGEFESSLIINVPCTIIGTNTTLWSKSGTIIKINSAGVELKNLRLEITEENPSVQDSFCLDCSSEQIILQNVEIVGKVKGLNGEDGFWDLPRVLNLKTFPANKITKSIVELYVPVVAELHCTINGIHLEPTSLTPGKNPVTITIDKVQNGTYFYGEIFVQSKLQRRISINGVASSSVQGFVDNETLYVANSPQQISVSTIPENATLLIRGERVNISELLAEDITIEFTCQNIQSGIDIEAYAFLLDKSGQAKTDEDLIFFGNTNSICNSLQYNADKSIAIKLSSLNNEVEKIAIAYSIYGDNPSHNFSKVTQPTIKIFSAGKKELCFIPEGLCLETTIVALEIYRYKNIWKLMTVGYGYHDGLKKLCESYGMTVY